jgi:putative acetyltransferase
VAGNRRHVRSPSIPRDRAALPALHTAAVEAFGPDSYDAEQVREWAGADERSPTDYTVDAAGEHFTVAVRDGEVAGFAHLVTDAGEVHAVYVHPDHARRGVGSALLAELEGYARGRELSALTLHSSLNAVEFYEQAGYERVGEDETASGLAVIEMEKQL